MSTTRISNRPYLPPAVDVTGVFFITGRAKAAAFAQTHHFFWLPCPLCGIEFGGHERMRSSDPHVYPDHIPDEKNPPVWNGTSGRMGSVSICPFCTNADRGWDHPLPDNWGVPTDAQGA